MKRLITVLLLVTSVAHAQQTGTDSEATVITQTAPKGYAIASAEKQATQAGMEIMQQGGNAFDAAVAVSAVLAVVEPYHTGIGGGGFWLLHTAKNNKNIFVDGRETAPMAASRNMYLNDKGEVIPDASLNGPLSAAIPGEPAALVYIAEKYGKLGLKKDLAPAIKYAKQGFAIDKDYREAMIWPKRVKLLQSYPESAKLFLKDGYVPPLGYVVIQNDLAKTLETIAEKGKAGFYEGEIAKQLVDDVRAHGGIWSLQDLKNYKIKIRKPLYGTYHGMRIITAPPPSAGGIALITMLNILSPFELNNMSFINRVHLIVESMRLAYWERAKYLGDPAFVLIPTNALISMGNANGLRARIKKGQATPSASLGKAAVLTEKSPNTTHFSIIDNQGNRVAATITINYLFGSGFVPKGTGVLLNDEMDDFSTHVGSPNVFGLVGTKANSIEPGKRPLSSMAPTFIETKDQVVIIGTPGGSRIPTMILLSILDFAKGHGVNSWVSLTRFHHQYLPDQIQYEPHTFTPAQVSGLKSMGYALKELPHLYFGDMQAVLWNKKTQEITAASDPRHVGLAEVWMK